MSVTVTALYENMETADTVVKELVENKFDPDQISIVTQGGQEESALHTGDTGAAVTAITHDAEIGAVVGGLGGLLVGLAALAIPGIGPLVAAGPIASTLLGLGVGAATGGFVGALSDVGVSYEKLEYYAEGIRQGHTLVAVHAPEERVEQVQAIFDRYHPVEQHTQTASPAGATASVVDMAKREAPVSTDVGPRVV